MKKGHQMANATRYNTSKGETRWRVRYRKPDGTQTDKRGFKRKSDAVNWAAEHVTIAKARGAYIDPQDAKTTVGELAGAWLDAKRTRVKPSYMDDLEDSWSVWVKPAWGDVPIGMVTRNDVQKWVTDIASQRSASVTLRAYGILAGILDNAVRDGMIHANHARGVELPRKKTKRHVYLTAPQLYSLAGECGWRRDIILTLGLCGMRWGELVPLRVRDVDLDRHRIMVDVSAPMVGGKVTPGDTKTHEGRSIMYPAVLDRIMHDRCEGRRPDDLLFEAPGRPGVYLKEFGAASSGDGWLASALRRAGISGHLTLHDLRHTAVSLMVSSGANVKAVQRQIGHKSAAMTLDTYADLFEADLDKLGERMGEMLLRESVGKMWADDTAEAA